MSFPDADESLVEKADNAAKAAQVQWWALTAQARGRAMYQVGNLIREALEDLAQIESLTANKPIRDARVEV
ncbi:Aldehyde dehydrogenase, partial [Pseudomonas viridiflava]